MGCQGCINRQRRLVNLLCKKPGSALCRRAQARLEKMLQDTEKANIARPEGVTSTAPASDPNVE
jgi:hypothetical protein